MSYSLKTIEERFVPYSIAKKYIKELIDTGSSSNLIQKTFDYLNSISRCDEDSASKIMKELEEIVKREDVRAVLASICPTTVEEVRSVLVIDPSTIYSTEQIQKIIEIIKKYVES
ncbi:DNA-directed RNA polymerase subunit F [Sulfolobus acidocaldarius SUSAZ]|nr:DNA-directed RNA polymerase subunit F [Sulfolobus acidocaldarius SUSAZ]